MPKMVLLAAFLSINGNDVSDRTHKVELTVEVEEKDLTTYASLSWKEVLGGLRSASLDVGFKQDVASGELDATMWALLGTVVPFVAKLDNSTTTTNNPAYTGNVLINGWKPISGSVGDVAEVEQSWPTSGVVTRTTS